MSWALHWRVSIHTQNTRNEATSTARVVFQNHTPNSTSVRLNPGRGEAFSLLITMLGDTVIFFMSIISGEAVSIDRSDLYGYPRVVKIKQLILGVLAAVSLVPAEAQASASTVGAPIRGAGILPGIEANLVSVLVQHAYTGAAKSTSGEFIGMVNRVSKNGSGAQWIGGGAPQIHCYLNVYKISHVSNGLESGLQETFLHRFKMLELSKIAVAPKPGEPEGFMFSTLFSTVATKIPNMEGEYRAEIVAYSIPGHHTPPSETTPPEARFEIGAADVLFRVGQNLNLAPVSQVEGGVRATCSYSFSRSATAAQRNAIYARARVELSKIYTAVNNYSQRHAGSATGTPSRDPWSWVWLSTTPTAPDTIAQVTKGQIYTSDKTKIVGEVNNLIKPFSRVHALPGGSVTITVSNGFSFTDL